MNTTPLPRKKPSLVEGVLAILTSVLIFTTLSLPEHTLMISQRATLILLAFTGFAMCRVAQAHDQPRKYTRGYFVMMGVLGGLSAVFVLGHLMGFDLPLVKSDRQALVILAALLLGQWILTAQQRLQSLK